jgi:hypothetical protein
MSYGEKETQEQAELRAKILADKNVGREYVVMEAKSSFKCTYEGVSLEENKY